MRINRIAASAAAVSLLVAVPAVAVAKVKNGAYVGTPSPEFQFIVKGSKINGVSVPCVAANGQILSTASVSKKIKVSSKGKFSFKGGVTLVFDSPTKYTVSLKGKISGKKGSAKLKILTPGTNCTAQTFKFKYYGSGQGG
jgi:hypothetical protein